MTDEFSDTMPEVCGPAAKTIEDTDELPGLATPQSVAEVTPQIRTHARAFLRFYRARSVLTRDQNSSFASPDRVLAAWEYLAPLAPSDLPEALQLSYRRIAFLAAQVRLDAKPETCADLMTKIVETTAFIDQMVDELLSREDARRGSPPAQELNLDPFPCDDN